VLQSCAKASMIYLKPCTITIKICINHVPKHSKHASSMCQNIHDMPQPCTMTIKMCINHVPKYVSSMYQHLLDMPQAYTNISNMCQNHQDMYQSICQKTCLNPCTKVSKIYHKNMPCVKHVPYHPRYASKNMPTPCAKDLNYEP
jgi:hypothetical protein